MTMTPSRQSLWTIREWHNSPDLAAIFQEIHDDRLTGRLMLHITQGQQDRVSSCASAQQFPMIPRSSRPHPCSNH